MRFITTIVVLPISRCAREISRHSRGETNEVLKSFGLVGKKLSRVDLQISAGDGCVEIVVPGSRVAASHWLPFGEVSSGAASSIRTQRSPVKIRAQADGSERPHHRAERNDGDQRYEGADDADHNDVAIAVPVRRSADREQCDHRTIVRQAIERA
jgi:hypothetical protein